MPKGFFGLILAQFLQNKDAAIRDALAGVAIPFVEVHLSNVYTREPFRHHSYFSDLAVGVIAGLGPTGYRCALQFAIETSRR
jgi:3-dehydroquinate dehydratase-2